MTELFGFNPISHALVVTVLLLVEGGYVAASDSSNGRDSISEDDVSGVLESFSNLRNFDPYLIVQV